MTLSRMHLTTADDHMAANEQLEVIQIASTRGSFWPTTADQTISRMPFHRLTGLGVE